MKTTFYLFIFLSVNLLFSQKTKVNGTWNLTLSTSNIPSAGEDYNAYYESKSNQSRITITPKPNSKYNKLYMPFKVFVHKEDLNWHENLNLELKLSSNKHGNSSGTQYQTISNYSSLFFNTIGSNSNLPIQYRISGLSVTLPADNYSTEIIYTVLNF